jgi:hypothetical protein
MDENENIKKKKKIENSVFSPPRKNALGPAADYRFYFLYLYEKVLRIRDIRPCACVRPAAAFF